MRGNRFRFRRFAAGMIGGAIATWTTACMVFQPTTPPPTEVSLYLIGNSLTDAVRYDGLASLAASQGHILVWGRHMIPGAPLDWIWDHPNEGFREDPYGTYRQAFTEYTWDYVTLQPFDRLLDKDLETITQYLSLLEDRSPDAQVFIYAQWPENNGQDWDTQWLQFYTGRWDGTQRSQDYYETLTKTLNEQRPDAVPVRMIPVGHVMYALNQRMKAGQVSGYHSITDLYTDSTHINGVGSYIVATTFYATIFQTSPVGLPVPSPYQADTPIPPEVADMIQKTVWEVVTTTPLAGYPQPHRGVAE